MPRPGRLRGSVRRVTHAPVRGGFWSGNVYHLVALGFDEACGGGLVLGFWGAFTCILTVASPVACVQCVQYLGFWDLACTHDIAFAHCEQCLHDVLR